MKGFLPLLFIAAVVISIVVVSQVYGRERSSKLILNGPTTTKSDEDDDGNLPTVGNESKVNTTTTPTTIYTALHTLSPTVASPPTSTEKVATNVPSAISSMLTKSPTLRPNSSPSETIRSRFPSALPTLEQPSQEKTITSLPSLTPTKRPSDEPTGSLTTKQPTSPPTDEPSLTPTTQTPTKEPIKTESVDDQTSLHHATNACLIHGETKVDVCLMDGISSPLGVNCCAGSKSTRSLTCSRPACFETNSYIAAKEYCEKGGMRLCTVDELDSGVCCNKGCGFNSRITWSSDICGPTPSPTKTPTTSPTTRTGTLVSSNGDRFVGDESSSIGIVFEVQALRDLAITSLTTFTDSETEVWSEVWIRRGRYEGNTSGNAGWKRVYVKKSQQHGKSAPLEIVFDEHVLIPEGQIMSIYLLSPGKFLSEQGNLEGSVVAEDTSLKLYTGAAIDYGRWEDGCTNDRECIFPARTFNGAINYETSTMAPTAQPTPDGDTMLANGLTLRDQHWLDGHNTRRKKYHEQYGKTYVPLKWSPALKNMAKEYADELASVCGPTVHSELADRDGYGENLASNTGVDWGSGSWGELKSVESVMYRFVEREEHWAPPHNYHFSQVLWRASTHVGCAESKGTTNNGTVCRYQVCRYARAGNCAMGNYNDGTNEWWMVPILRDASPCQPYCPPEGC